MELSPKQCANAWNSKNIFKISADRLKDNLYSSDIKFLT